jgi:hypothetical protein
MSFSTGIQADLWSKSKLKAYTTRGSVLNEQKCKVYICILSTNRSWLSKIHLDDRKAMAKQVIKIVENVIITSTTQKHRLATNRMYPPYAARHAVPEYV